MKKKLETDFKETLESKDDRICSLNIELSQESAVDKDRELILKKMTEECFELKRSNVKME